MGTSHVESFTASVRDVGGAVTRTEADEFAGALSSAVRDQTIGTELPFEGVSYEGTPVEPSPSGADLTTATTGVTAGRLGIADYGSVVLQETGEGEELLGLYPELHVVVVAASDIVPDMPKAFEELDADMREGPTDAVIATGPSATADMGALVTGVHGPEEVHVIVLEDR